MKIKNTSIFSNIFIFSIGFVNIIFGSIFILIDGFQTKNVGILGLAMLYIGINLMQELKKGVKK